MRNKAAICTCLAAASLLPNAAFADQYKQAADNARIECVVSKQELSRIALIGDQFASVSKISSGTPYNDFAVTNEPVRGDIYISVPVTYAAGSISFFATTKKGFVYKFACKAEMIEAQQLFISNPALAKSDATNWENQTRPDQSAVRLIQAMATDKTIEGFQIRQSASPAARVGNLEIQLVAEYRGGALLGKVLRLTNRSKKPLPLAERDLAPSDTLAISIGEPNLAPGASTTALIVGANGDYDHD